jgi:hypothetical protein
MEPIGIDRSLEVAIATSENGKWRVVYLPLWSSNMWQTIRIYGPGKREQERHWQLGWNQQRLSRSAEATILQKRHPAIYRWIVKTLVEWGGSEARPCAQSSWEPPT